MSILEVPIQFLSLVNAINIVTIIISIDRLLDKEEYLRATWSCLGLINLVIFVLSIFILHYNFCKP